MNTYAYKANNCQIYLYYINWYHEKCSVLSFLFANLTHTIILPSLPLSHPLCPLKSISKVCFYRGSQDQVPVWINRAQFVWKPILPHWRWICPRPKLDLPPVGDLGLQRLEGSDDIWHFKKICREKCFHLPSDSLSRWSSLLKNSLPPLISLAQSWHPDVAILNLTLANPTQTKSQIFYPNRT